MSVDDEVTNIRKFEIHICEPCLNLEGEMCSTPECYFCWRSMDEVSFILNACMIRPKVDGNHIPEILCEFINASAHLPSKKEYTDAAPCCPDADKKDVLAHNWFIAGAEWVVNYIKNK